MITAFSMTVAVIAGLVVVGLFGYFCYLLRKLVKTVGDALTHKKSQDWLDMMNRK